MRALVGGRLFEAGYQRQWLDSPEPQDPSKLLGQKYGYGISQIIFGPNSLYFHGGEMPGYNSYIIRARVGIDTLPPVPSKQRHEGCFVGLI